MIRVNFKERMLKRDGYIPREEAVALVIRYDGEFPNKYFNDFLEYLDITEQQFWEVADSYRLDHVWEKSNNEWLIKNKVK